MSQVRNRVLERLGTVYGDRAWVVVGDIVQAAGSRVAEVRRLGARRCLGIGARQGTGRMLDTAHWDAHVLGLPPADMTTSIRTAEQAMDDLPDVVRASVDAFDPDALVLGPFFWSGRPVAGRRTYGARPASWQALDDKTSVDAFWDAAGVPRAPSEIVPVDLEGGRAAAARVDRGDGTVWTADNRDGWHGGGSGTFPVLAPGDDVRAIDALARTSDVMRVMPFLRGVPCSIHGIVLPDGVAVFRPNEMLVLKGPKGLVYGRFGTFWDPAPEHREAMREVARKTGAHLVRTVGYRGGFSVDGVLTDDGFFPTELNPRLGAAMMSMLAPFPVWSFHDALIEGFDPGVSAAALEADLLAQADAHRFGAPGFFPDVPLPEVDLKLAWTGDAWVDTDDADATALLGPGPGGGYARLRLEADRIEKGPSLAPMVAAFARYLDERYDTGIGPLKPSWVR